MPHSVDYCLQGQEEPDPPLLPLQKKGTTCNNLFHMLHVRKNEFHSSTYKFCFSEQGVGQLMVQSDFPGNAGREEPEVSDSRPSFHHFPDARIGDLASCHPIQPQANTQPGRAGTTGGAVVSGGTWVQVLSSQTPFSVSAKLQLRESIRPQPFLPCTCQHIWPSADACPYSPPGGPPPQPQACANAGPKGTIRPFLLLLCQSSLLMFWPPAAL
jgi:hypothetical protein